LKLLKEGLIRQEGVFQKQLLLKRGITAETVKLNWTEKGSSVMYGSKK